MVGIPEELSIDSIECCYSNIWGAAGTAMFVVSQNIAEGKVIFLEQIYHTNDIKHIVYQPGTDELWSIDSAGEMCIWDKVFFCLSFYFFSQHK